VMAAGASINVTGRGEGSRRRKYVIPLVAAAIWPRRPLRGMRPIFGRQTNKQTNRWTTSSRKTATLRRELNKPKLLLVAELGKREPCYGL